MPRVVRNSRRPIAVVRRPLEIDSLDASEFFNLVHFLEYLDKRHDAAPFSENDQNGQQHAPPSAKRQKTQPDARYVPLARRTYTFQAPSDKNSTATDQPLRIAPRPVNKPLTFSSAVHLGCFIIRNRVKVPGITRVDFRIPYQLIGDLTKADHLLLTTVGNTGDGDPGPGGMWTRANLGMDDDGTNTTLTMELELRWNVSFDFSLDLHSEPHLKMRTPVIETLYPELVPDVQVSRSGWSPQDFYGAAHVPSKDTETNDHLYVPGLTAELFPFQRRAVRWLLNREGVSAPRKNSDGSLDPYREPSSPAITSHFRRVMDADGEPFYASELYGIATRDPSHFEAMDKAVRGGILSEEMGLGKTVEMISLMLLHSQSPDSAAAAAASNMSTPLRPTGATLIVTPPALKNQWISELQRHAPNLRVMEYKGAAASKVTTEKAEAALVDKLSKQDVVITTYNSLTSELHFALEPPERSRRRERKYHRPKSPLVQLLWWRVCLDEAQEVESGVTNAATVLRVIPRINSWGVTGTPIKDGVQDLWGLLLFLRYDPYASSQKIWKKLISKHKEAFQALFGRLALRHTKQTVGDELSIPPQKRYVITMPFTAVEEQHYQSLFKQLAETCGLDTQGAPLSPEWDPEAAVEAMRSALHRLRQTTLHPEIGEQNRRALGHRAGPMRTVAEVLDAMIDQSASALLSDRRTLLNQKLKRGQLLENSPRVKAALDIWQEALKEAKVLVQEARDKLKLEMDKAEEDGAAAKQGHNGLYDDDEDDYEDDEKAALGRVTEAQRDLRYALEIQHKAEFFVANAYYQIKSNEEMTKPDTEEFKELEKLEVEAYERAKVVRNEILNESRSKAMELMDDIAGKATSQGFVTMPECVFTYPKGIEGRNIAADMERLSEMLDSQANQMDEWREAVIQLLLKDLVDEDDNVEITGDEYENSTKVQDEIQVYLTMLKLGISDRHAVLTGLARSGLTLFEERQALQMALDGDGPAPELTLKLFQGRTDYLIPEEEQVRSLRGVMVDLRDIATRLRDRASRGNRRAQVELECISAQLDSATNQQTRQLKANAELEQEVTKIRIALNRRIGYYRQLQIVSDMVALYEGEKDDAAMAACIREEEDLRRTVATTESKYKYLIHLKEADANEDSRLCVICQSTFTVGVLTVCGHRFCKECIMAWFRAHRNCPMCKRKLNANNLHDIILKPQELKVVTDSSQQDQDSSQQQQLARTKKTGIYADFNAQKLEEIKNIDLPGPSFTTKVDTLVRHLLWLRASDAGAKTIIFSQFPDFLNVVAQALTQHHVGFSQYADANGIAKFQQDASIECFLLHARAHSSGLNLVNASHVILCEPLLNTALELQAIARVHRIGQQQETTVWLYIVDGTVEESVYNLSVQRRLEHIGRSSKLIEGGKNGKGKGQEVSGESTPEVLDSSLEIANTLEMEEAQLSTLMSKGKMSGEEVPKDDLWQCLFGNRAQHPGDEEAAADEERLRNNVEVRRFLAANAAEQRQQAGEAVAGDE